MRRLRAWHGWLPIAGQKPIGIWREPREWIEELWRRRQHLLEPWHLPMVLKQPIVSVGDKIRVWRLVTDAAAHMRCRCNLSDCAHRPVDDLTIYRDDNSGDYAWWCMCGNAGEVFAVPFIADGE